MSSPEIRPRNNKPAAGGQHVPMVDGKGSQQTLRVLSEDGAVRAAAPSVAMPRATTELLELLAGDNTLCVRRASATATPHDAEALAGASGADAGSKAESPATLWGQQGSHGADVSPPAPTVDADLARVIDAWPGLPRSIRVAVLALVRESRPGEV